MNSLMEAGYQKEDTMLIKQAGDRVSNARKVFGNLCWGDKETSIKGGSIGRTMEEYIASLGLDLGKEEDINTLCSTVGKAHCKGAKAFGELMKAWDDWDRVALWIGKSSEVTGKDIKALQLYTHGMQEKQQKNR